MSAKPCRCCGGRNYSDGVGDRINYVRMPSGFGTCPRCKDGVEPEGRVLHPGLILENRRSGKRWAIFADYGEGWPGDRRWGIHRFRPSRRGGHYVWQIKMLPAVTLLDGKRWREVGFGDAWNHDLMQSDPLPPRR